MSFPKCSEVVARIRDVMIHLKESILESNRGHFLKFNDADSDSILTLNRFKVELIPLEKFILIPDEFKILVNSLQKNLFLWSCLYYWNRFFHNKLIQI